MAERINTAQFMVETGINANATTLSKSLELGAAFNYSVEVVANTGANTTHVVTAQTSSNDSDWTDASPSVTITGVGINDNNTTAFRFIRLKVTTNEGGASTVDWYINAR